MTTTHKRNRFCRMVHNPASQRTPIQQRFSPMDPLGDVFQIGHRRIPLTTTDQSDDVFFVVGGAPFTCYWTCPKAFSLTVVLRRNPHTPLKADALQQIRFVLTICYSSHKVLFRHARQVFEPPYYFKFRQAGYIQNSPPVATVAGLLHRQGE